MKEDLIGSGGGGGDTKRRFSERLKNKATEMTSESRGTMEDPLTNKVIMEALFERCDWKDLNVYRLVCKDWYGLSLPSWRRKGPTLCLSASHSKGLHAMKLFLDEVLGGGKEGFSTIGVEFQGLRRYKDFKIEEVVCKSHWKLVKSILTRCGDYITKLQLDTVVFRDLRTCKTILSCQKTPNLEILKLSFISYLFEANHDELIDANDKLDLSADTPEMSKATKSKSSLNSLDIHFVESTRLAVSWTELFNWHPKLQRLRICQSEDFWGVEADKCFNAYTKIRGLNPSTLKLTSLEIVGVCDSEANCDHIFRKFFVDNQLELECLSLHSLKNISGSILEEVIAHQSNSLKRLELMSGWDKLIELPILKNLELVTITTDKVESLDILKKCERLKSISLMSCDEDISINVIRKTKDEDMQGFAMHSLREFRCNYIVTNVDYAGEDIRRLSTWMPNLQSLELRKLTAEAFRMVCELLPTLEKLKFYPGPDVDDEVITGIPRVSENPDSRLHPNLTDLKELRCLHMTEDKWWTSDDEEHEDDRSTFTDKTVQFGFLKMVKLQSLSFNANAITPNTMDLLRAKIPDVKVE